MSRGIKFRAFIIFPISVKDCEFGGFILDDITKISFLETGEHVRVTSAKDGDFIIHNSRLMQFTGLQDSNGKDIYEGDIVKWDDASSGRYWRVAVVEWHKSGSWNYRTIPQLCINCLKNESHDFKLGSFIYTPDASQYGNVLEIIGNIYEHPNLLDRPSESP